MFCKDEGVWNAGQAVMSLKPNSHFLT
jgi:hypothetical protein